MLSIFSNKVMPPSKTTPQMSCFCVSGHWWWLVKAYQTVKIIGFKFLQHFFVLMMILLFLANELPVPIIVPEIANTSLTNMQWYNLIQLLDNKEQILNLISWKFFFEEIKCELIGYYMLSIRQSPLEIVMNNTLHFNLTKIYFSVIQNV